MKVSKYYHTSWEDELLHLRVLGSYEAPCGASLMGPASPLEVETQRKCLRCQEAAMEEAA